MEPTQQDKAEQVDELAGNATRACFARFRSCITALDGEHRNHLEVRFTDLKLWADSVGALAHGKASLDWRLSGRSRDKFLVTSLLDMLEQFLEGYKTAAIEDGDEDEIKEAVQGIDEITDNLAWIGSAIRRSGTKSRLQKADMSFEHDRAGKDKRQCDQLRAHLICIIKSRPTEPATSEDYSKDFHSMELQGVQNRLVEANLRRWHRFRYAQRHSDVLRASRAVQNMPMHVIPEDSPPDSTAEPTNTPAPRINTAAAKQRNEANDQGETRTTSGSSASAFGSEYQGLEGRYAQPAKSTMTRVSTITGFARFPKAKKPQTQRKTLLCPCCCQALPLEEAEDPDLWAKHMKHDISPYTCIVENCPTPYRFYVTRNAWREHVLYDHPPKWRCSCCTGTRPVFQSLPSFIAHLDEKHESQVSDKTFERIMAKSTFRSFGIANCPLCNDQGPTDSPELIEHVLGHVYDFSMYALPWRTTLQKGLKKPIRTFNDVAPVLDPNDDEDATEMRLFSHTRILKWVEEPHPEEEKLTPEQKATIRGLDWDDCQAMDNEDGADPIVADYFDRAEIDYFDDDASSRGASSQTGHSASTRQLSIASSTGHSSRAQANPLLSAQEMDSPLAKATIINEDESISDKDDIEGMYERALPGYKGALGGDHPEALSRMANLASTYGNQGRWEEAEKLQVQVIETCKTILGVDHPDTLTNMANLVSIYKNQGRWEEAEKLQVQVIETYKTKLGADHPDILTSMANLALIFWNQGRWEKAEKLEIQVMEISKTKLGVNHPDTLTSMANLASTFWNQGRWEEAEKLQVQVMETRKTKLGVNHPDTLTSMANLALTYGNQGRWEEAEKLQVQVIKTRKTMLGVDHPDILTSMANLALTFWNQGRWEEAEKLEVQVMEISKTKLGVYHPDTLTSMANLVLIYRNQGQWEEAEKLQVQIMETSKINLGVDHPEVLSRMANLASTYGNQGRWEEAEKLQVQVMETRKTKLGADHPDTLTSMNNLAFTWNSQDRYKEALALMESCVQAQQRVLGIHHPDTVSSLHTLEEWRLTRYQPKHHRSSSSKQLQGASPIMFDHNQTLTMRQPDAGNTKQKTILSETYDQGTSGYLNSAFSMAPDLTAAYGKTNQTQATPKPDQSTKIPSSSSVRTERFDDVAPGTSRAGGPEEHATDTKFPQGQSNLCHNPAQADSS